MTTYNYSNKNNKEMSGSTQYNVIEVVPEIIEEEVVLAIQEDFEEHQLIIHQDESSKLEGDGNLVVITSDNPFQCGGSVEKEVINRIKKSFKKKKRKISEQTNNEDLLPNKCKMNLQSSESYVNELQVSALEFKVDFQRLTFFKLANILSKEQSTFILAIKTGLINVEPGKCRKCDSQMYLTQLPHMKGFHEFRCPRPCRAKLSILENTCFSNCHIELSQVLQITYCWCASLTLKQAEFHCSVGLGAVIDFYKLCRRVCLSSLILDSLVDRQLGDGDSIVEVGTTNFEKLKKSKTLKKNENSMQKESDDQKRYIFTAFCRESKEVVVAELDKPDNDTLLNLIKKYVARDSTLICTFWKNVPNLEAQLDKLGYSKCSTNSPATKTHVTFIEYVYNLKYPTPNPGVKFERILSDIAKVYPGAFLSGIKEPILDLIR